MQDITVPFNALSLQWQEIRAQALSDLENLFEQNAFCLGPWVEKFEQACADYLGISHAIAVNSGTSALHLAMIAANVGANDKVIVPAQSFIGTVWGVLYQGAIPVFCDVDVETGTLSVEGLEASWDPAVKAIIPVHLFGQPANMTAILAFAKQKNIAVIEDAAQAFGAVYQDKKAGTLGKLGCFSFYPGKNLGAAGEGGLVVTEDAAITARLRALRSHAQSERYIHHELGFNYRMDGLQGLFLQHKLPYLPQWTAQRIAIAAQYQAGLLQLPLTLPQCVHAASVWHLYVIRTPKREALRDYLTARGIETGLHYPVPLHQQPVLRAYITQGQHFPHAEQWAKEGLSLPIYPGMTADQVAYVISAIKDFFHD